MLNLEDYFYTYPEISDPNFQTLISGRQEFRSLASDVREPPPRPGEMYRHQELYLRYFLQYDKSLLIHETGTGKTCSTANPAELALTDHIEALGHYVDNYLQPRISHIRQVYVLASGDTLLSEYQNQLACRCTAGTYLRQLGKATNLISAKAAITRALHRKGYKFQTFRTFASQVSELSDQAVRDVYSNSYFIVDEAHYLPTGETQASRRAKTETTKTRKPYIRSYDQVWRVFHLAENLKISLLTATPMTNDPAEIREIMNLILPLDQQMPPQSAEFDYHSLTLEQVEPYFRGRVSYVRALETGAVASYQGYPLINLDQPQQVLEASQQVWQGLNPPPVADLTQFGSQTIIFPSLMSELQSQAYYSVGQGGHSSFYANERQVANFVFPDGSYGQAGYQQYVLENPENRRLYLHPQLVQALISNNQLDLDKLALYSTKFATFIALLESQPGIHFAYIPQVTGGGANLLGLILELGGYQKFDTQRSVFQVRPGALNFCGQEGEREIIIPKAKRYAILTGEEANFEAIRALINARENRHGDYIRTIIVSPKGKVGINFANAIAGHILAPEWTRSDLYQAISRILRSTSHVDLLAEERERLRLAGLDPNTATIQVNLYQHASFLMDGSATADSTLYLLTEEKDRAIARIFRFLKQTAFDCQIHYQRNVRPTDVDYSAQCDYQVCAYGCSNQPPTDINYQTYNLLYAQRDVADLEALIKRIFGVYTILPRSRLLAIIREIIAGQLSAETSQLLTLDLDLERKANRLKELLPDQLATFTSRALSNLMDSQTSFKSRVGYDCYLREEQGIYFLQTDFPTKPLARSWSAYYVNNLIGVKTLTLESYIAQQNILLDQEAVTYLQSLNPISQQGEFYQILGGLSLDTQVSLLEESLPRLFLSPAEEQTAYDLAIYGYFHFYVYWFYEPVEAITEQQARLSGRRGSGQVKIPKLNVIKIRAGDYPQIKQEGQLMIVHTLYSAAKEGVSYATVAKISKGEGRTRLYPLAAGLQGNWRDASPAETLVYGLLIQIEFVQRQGQVVGDAQVYGTYHQAEARFRVVDKRGLGQEASQDSRRDRTGQICSQSSKPKIIDIMAYLKVVPPGLSLASLAQLTDQDLRHFLSSKKLKVSLNQLDRETLEYYYLWYVSGLTLPKICNILYNWFQSHDLLVII